MDAVKNLIESSLSLTPHCTHLNNYAMLHWLVASSARDLRQFFVVLRVALPVRAFPLRVRETMRFGVPMRCGELYERFPFARERCICSKPVHVLARNEDTCQRR